MPLLLAGASLSALCAVPATAQQADDSVALTEVVVTAQRREESLQKVPIAVSVVGGESLQASGITNTDELTYAVPGLFIQRTNISVTPYIRGVGNKNTGQGDESAAAIYIDGVYLASQSAGFFALNNIERIEVLKGPQGTLFGRNTSAGVIQIITKAPTHDPQLQVTAGYGNYNTLSLSGYASFGVTDAIATDLSVTYVDQNDGWGRNVTTGKKMWLGRDLMIRNKWVAEPSDATRMTLSLDYGNVIPITPQAFLVRPPSRLVGGETSVGFYNGQSDIEVRGKIEQWGGSFKLEQDLGFANFVSISSYRGVKAGYIQDSDARPIHVTHAAISQFQTTYTQEFQLLSPKESKLSWILGAYYFNDSAGYDPITFLLASTTQLIYSKQNTESYAVFGQATVPVTERTKVTAGLRYTEDKREIRGHLRVGLPPLPVAQQTVFKPAFTGGTFSPIPTRSDKFPKLTYRFAVDHEFSDGVLAYASASRGFKSGVYNTVAPADPPVEPAVVDSYEIGLKSELFDRRVRLNLAAYYNDLKDIQFQVPLAVGTRNLNAASGRSKGVEGELVFVPARGALISASASYNDAKYKSFANAPFFIDLPTGGTRGVSGDASGNRMIMSPRFTARLSAQYRFETEMGDITPSASLSYTSKFYYDPENTEIASKDGYARLSGALTWTAPSKKWDVQLWGDNLTNEKIFTFMLRAAFGNYYYPAAPRTYGVRVTARM